MILVSYDGSADARAAIDRAAQLMPGAEVTVLTVWEPFREIMTRTGSMGMGRGMGMGMDVGGDYAESEEIDAASRESALSSATEGAERAAAAGLVAQPRWVSRHGGVANTILAAAAEVDADLVVMGTRGLSGVESFLLGSVSHAVVHHADRAVLVVPSPALAKRRRDWVHRDESPA
jgi:nucleotide-binding universal stress UspA family protein